MKERTEYVRYTRADLEELVKCGAKLRLIGSIYRGSIGEQEVRWSDDGSVEVLTKHTPALENA